MIVRAAVPLAPLTTLRLGGRAARLAEVGTEEDVVAAVHDADARSEKVFVLGAGSNVVVGDGGFPGLTVRMAMRGVAVRRDGDRVTVDVAAGEEWDALVGRAVGEGWAGIESISGVPGLVGATPIQNVGAYGQEVCETIVSVRAYDRPAAAFVDIDGAACGFAYRASIFKRSDRWIVTSVKFAFPLRRDGIVRYAELARALGVAEGARAPSDRVREAVIALRRSKGMVSDGADPESVSVGSFFVNPVVDAAVERMVAERAGATPPAFDAPGGKRKIAAGWLVEHAGFTKGWGQGSVGVSRKHALALVHRGGGTTGELLALARTIRDGVRARFGVVLEPEPVFVGCSWG
ncbi:MAG TPA: UDP-N-acetylmuramate dehydrogenase [Polyangiaceae bacterium]|jgi:UDP-N-acetylmuramate dehydrogenase